MWAQVYVHVCEGQKTLFGVIAKKAIYSMLDSLPLAWNLPVRLDWASEQGIFLLLLPQCWDCKHASPNFSMGSADWI